MSVKRPLVVSIEGNIGAGKSTILDALKSRININGVFMQEPVNVWETVKDESNKTILMKYYENPEKYAFPFQIMAYTTRLHALKSCIENNSNCDVIVCERSLEADKNIFAKMLYDDSMIECVSYQIYNMLYNNTANAYRADAIIYMRADPKECLFRIHKRLRNGENNISMEYLESCHKYYDEWLMAEHDGDHGGDHDRNNIPILVLDVNDNVDYNEDNGVGQKWILQISQFINGIIENK